MRHLLQLLIFLMIISFSAHGNGQWEMIKEDQGIRVYIKTNTSSDYIEIKALSHVNSPLESFVALMNDVDNFKNWMHATRKATLVERAGPFRYTYYMLSDLPWPASDRDVILDLSIHQNQQTKAIYTKSRNVEGLIDEKEGIKRIESVKTSWRFIPEDEGRVRIVFQTRIKPGVHLPQWMAEKVYHRGPYHTIIKMKQMIQEKKYSEAAVDMKQLNDA